MGVLFGGGVFPAVAPAEALGGLIEGVVLALGVLVLLLALQPELFGNTEALE
jgi:hypothetical protein